MIVLWDTSAAVKLVRAQRGSELAEQLWRGGDTAAASALVLPEVASTLARNRADGRLDGPTYDASMARWQRYAAQFALLVVHRERGERAAELVAVTGLRGAAAVHLASAVDLADRGAEVTLATWDRRLHATALDQGLGVVPASI